LVLIIYFWRHTPKSYKYKKKELVKRIIHDNDSLSRWKSFSINYCKLLRFPLAVLVISVLRKWLLFSNKWTIFQLYHSENKLHFDKMMITIVALYETIMFC